MSWHFVERWLQKVYQHSTLIGKFWITFLIVFRIVVVSSVSDRVYSDEQSEFRCNTGQVGCGNICFNQFSPMSHIRFWSFQIIMVSTPTILFMVYSAHQVKSTEKKDSKNTKQMREKQRMEERQMRRQSMYPGPGGAVPPGGMDPHGATGAHLRRASAHPNAVPGNPNLMPNLNSPQQEKISNKKSVTSSPETKNGGNKKSVMNAHDHSNPHHHHHHHHHGPPPGLRRKNSIKMGAGGDMGGVLQSAAHSHPPTAQKLSKMADEDKQSFMNHFLLYTVSVVMRTIIELLFMCLQWYVFGWKVATLYKCVGHPCPNTVDCYVSRPWEKTILLWFMYGVAAISTAMNLIELNYLLSHWVSTRLQTLRERRMQLQNSKNNNYHKNDRMFAGSPVYGMGHRALSPGGPPEIHNTTAANCMYSKRQPTSPTHSQPNSQKVSVSKLLSNNKEKSPIPDKTENNNPNNNTNNIANPMFGAANDHLVGIRSSQPLLAGNENRGMQRDDSKFV